MSLTKNSKGQALSIDLVVAGLIFLLIIGGAFSLYNNQKALIQEQLSLQDMHLSGINAINTMLSDQNCYRGGLAREKNIVSTTTMACIAALDYNMLKDTLSLSPYEFTLTITDGNNTTLLQKGYTTSNRAVAIQRIVSDTNNLRKINFVVYEK